MNKIQGMLVGLSLSLAAVGVAAADGGQITAAQNATINRGQSDQPVKIGDAVSAGNELSTQARGRVQWRMDDGSVSALGGDSKFKIESYALPKNNGGAGRSVMKLLRGAFRSVSGLIGKSGRDVYEVSTPVATMGIRGTTYALALCEGGTCKGGDADNPVSLADGLYVGVDEGLVEISNDAGKLLVPAGKRAFVASKNTKPVFVDAWPNQFFDLERQMAFDNYTLEPAAFGGMEIRSFEAAPTPVDPNDPTDPPASGS